MKTLCKFIGDNMGGIAFLWIIPPADVQSITPTQNNTYNISFKTTNNIYKVYFTAETATYQEPKKETDAGISYQPSFSAVHPKITPESQAGFNYLDRRPCMFIFQDQNGYFKLVGDTKAPLIFSSNQNLPAAIKSLNKITFTIKGNTIHPSKFINNPF